MNEIEHDQPTRSRPMTDTDTYTVVVKFMVTDDSDEHLHDAQAIRDEVTSWLEGLGATVHAVTVHQEGEAS
jgi:hypothetical protein